MKKLAIGVLSAGALAVAGGLGTSYYIGGKIQEALEQTADVWSSEDGFTVRVLEYDRGLLRSHAQTLWSFASEEEIYDITVTHDILHGPWPMGKAAKVVSQFLLPEDSDPQLIDALRERAPLEWVTTASWSGKTQHTLFSPNFAASFDDGSSLTWGGLQADWTLSPERTDTSGTVRMPVLRVKVEDGSRLDVEDTEITFDTHMPAGYSFWLGPTALKIGLMAVQSTEDESQLKLQGLTLNTSNLLQDKLVQSGLDAQLQQLEMPSLQAKDLALSMQFKNWDADWVNQLMLWLQSGTQAPAIDWQSSLPALLAGKPELAISRLSMQSADGPVTFSARIAYTGSQPEAFNPAADLEGQLRTTLPLPTLVQLLETKVRNDYLALLEQMNHALEEKELQAAVDDGVSKRLKALLSQGAVLQQGDTVEAALEFAHGEFKLNNRPQTLQQLLGIGSGL